MTTDADECKSVCAVGGLELFGWQHDVLEAWLSHDRSGRWAASVCGLSVPRQNGKSLGVIVPRMVYGALVLGERIVYTAHLQKTSTETFEEVRDFFERKPFKPYIADIKTALGRERVIFKPLSEGARAGEIKFLARTRNGGRGQHGDLLVFDEAQELTKEQQASFLPAISASANPQTIYAGTPPDESADGSVFTRIRAEADAKASTAWAEWSVPDCEHNGDKSLWYATNPSLGLTIRESTIQTEFDQMDDETFARERLGWWKPRESEAVEHLIDAEAWAECRTQDPPAEGRLTVGVKFAPDGSSSALSVCVRPKAGKPYLECIDARSMGAGVGWLADWIVQRKDGIAAVAVDGRFGAMALVTKLVEGGVSSRHIKTPSASDVAGAASMMATMVQERQVEHFGQPALDDSVTGAAKRQIGRDGFGFASTDDCDATLAESCSLALWQAMTTKAKPGRKSVCY